MFNTAFKSIFRDLYCLVRRVEDALAEIGAERRCAQRLDRLSDRLTGMGSKIDGLRARMQEISVNVPMDEDFSLRGSLKSLKQDIRDIRCQVASLHGANLPPRLQRALIRLSGIAEATYVRADKLQWEIDERASRLAAPGG